MLIIDNVATYSQAKEVAEHMAKKGPVAICSLRRWFQVWPLDTALKVFPDEICEVMG